MCPSHRPRIGVDRFRVLPDPTAVAPGTVVSRSNLEVHEIDGGITSGPANTIEVDLGPMEAQVVAV
jgi:hypothetical protein